MTDLHDAALGFGSNIGDGRRNIAAALSLLVGGGVEIVMLSRLYSTSPVGPQGQPDFANAAALARTSLDPHGLLALCKSIERELGRASRPVKWGPRIIDIDILLYDSVTVQADDLVIPHPELGNRLFALVPLLDAAPDMLLPDGTPVRAFAENRISELQSSGQNIIEI
jgi:2-amino-4-hydroxy-6-hydroxymethyldihydropteridine diphosphokinase